MTRAVAAVCFVLALVAVGAVTALVSALNAALRGIYD